MADIIKMIQSNDLLKVLLVLLGVYLYVMYTSKPKEGISNISTSDKPTKVSQAEPLSAADDQQQQQVDSIVAGKTQLTAEDLLPKYDDANEFAKQNPVSKLLKEQNFLISGYHMGINTVMQSNKIPYWDLRSAPPIPKETVSPWGQSSYDNPVGANRRPLEIGQ